MPKTQRWLGMILGGALGCAMLWWSLRVVSIDAVVAIVTDSSPRYLAMAVLAAGAFIAVKTWRWKLLLEPIAPVSFSDLYGPVNIGTAANLLVSHVGELARARLLSRGPHKVPMTTVLASIGSERILDLFTILILASWLLLGSHGEFDVVLERVTDSAAMLSLLLAVVMISMALHSDAWLRLFDSLAQRLPERQRVWLRRQMVNLIGGFRPICRPTLFLRALLVSTIQWLLIAVALWCCAKSIGLVLQPSAAILVLIVMVFGLTLPTAPGYLGTTQVAFIVALAIFGVSRSVAFATSILYSAFVVLPMFACGAVVFFRQHGRQSVPTEARP